VRTESGEIEVEVPTREEEQLISQQPAEVRVYCWRQSVNIASATRADADLSGAALKVEPPSRLTNRYRARAERCAVLWYKVNRIPNVTARGFRSAAR
jgi:hypothetical protein